MFRRKVSGAVVRCRYPFLAVFLILSVFAATAIGRTVIEYDLTKYLSPDTPTKRGLMMMEGSFEPTESISVMLEGPRETAEDFCRRAEALEGVISVQCDLDRVEYSGGSACRLVRILCDGNSVPALDLWLDSALDGVKAEVAGGVRATRTIREALSEEIPVIMALSCLFVLGVLLFMNRNLLEPALFFLVIGISIVLNMGTNWLFPSVSFITFAVAAILQLALAMDYSIMMLNAYKRRLAAENDRLEAARLAVEDTLMPVSSSAMTTVAGMLSLLFMSFTIGFDIGIVLVKGIILSLLSVFLCMPALLTLFAGRLRRLSGRAAPVKGRLIAKTAVGKHGVVAIALLAVIVIGFAAHQRTVYSYKVTGTDPAEEKIAAVFGRDEALVILFPTARSDADYDRQREAVSRILDITAGDKKVVTGAMSMVTTLESALTYLDSRDLAGMMNVSPFAVSLGAAALNIVLPQRADILLEEVAARWDSAGLSVFLSEDTRKTVEELAASVAKGKALLEGKTWSRAILEMNLSYGDPETAGVLSEIRRIMTDTYGGEWGMTGTLPASDDIANTFSSDVWRVGLITLAAVFLIIAVSFRSLWIPAILVCVIQGAIWINIGFSSLMDGSVFFMCYIICMALQMGATIDYAILMTNHYVNLRKEMPPDGAIAQAVERSLRTILTSGLSFVTAGFTVGLVSSVYYIASIGTLLGRGALVSLILVLFLLPRLLVVLDGRVTARKRPSHDVSSDE